MDLSFIIVNWHSRKHLERCLESILAGRHGLPSFEIVVIDSGSFDGCGDMLRVTYPDVRFLQSRENLGFARANNVAFRSSTGTWVCFLNPDTEVVDSAIPTLLAKAQALPNAGAVGCRLLNADGSLQSSCVQTYPTILNQTLGAELLMRWRPLRGLWGDSIARAVSSGHQEVDAISGACVLMRRDVFEAIGGFSEDYFMYAEDVDLSHKAQRAGYRNYYVPEAEIIHYGGASSSQATTAFSAVMMREANWRFLRKTRGSLYAAAYRAAMLASALGRVAILAAASVSGRGDDSVLAARRKWMAILGWTVGRDQIVRQFYTR